MDFMLNLLFQHSNEVPQEVHEVHRWKVGSLSDALKTVSAISGPTIFCSVLKNFQAVSWAGCRHRSIKVTTPSKQICIKNKVNLSSVNWKFKRRSGTSFNLSQWIKFKICHFQLKLLLKQIKTVQKLFQFCPKLNNKT